MSTTGTSANPAATDRPPFFLPGADGSDPLMTIMGWFLVILVFLIGILYLKLHALPEHMASSSKKLQMDIVAVLALIALFTHQNIFWLAALILAMIEFPDFGTPLQSMAASLDRLAGKAAAPEPDATSAVPASLEPAMTEEAGKA